MIQEEVIIEDLQESLEMDAVISGAQPSGRQYANWPHYARQWTSYADYDEGYQWQNGILNKTVLPYPEYLPEFDRAKGERAWFWLTQNNIWGNKCRFTNAIGDHYLDGYEYATAWAYEKMVDVNGVPYTGNDFNVSAEVQGQWQSEPTQDHYFGIEFYHTSNTPSYTAAATNHEDNYAEILGLNSDTGGGPWYAVPMWLHLALTWENTVVWNYNQAYWSPTQVFYATATTYQDTTTQFWYSSRNTTRSSRNKTQPFNSFFIWRPMAGF